MATLQEITSLSKRRGFIYPGSEIYGGLKGFWDYGPLGLELKNNIKREWWKNMVYGREDIVGVDAAIIMNPKVWKASGHTEAFTDPLVECKKCHKRFRTDHLLAETPGTYYEGPGVKGKATTFGPSGARDEKPNDFSIVVCPNCKEKGKFSKPRIFNLLTEVLLGATEPKQMAYLRGEITQGVFVNFKNVIDSTRMKIPFGIAQIGKAFRNEITPGNLTYRSREFEQMELEYFIKPDKKEADKLFQYWKEQRFQWYVSLGMDKKKLRFRPHAEDERAHYARSAEDIEYEAPFGWSEFEGIHNRGDWDLSRHKLDYQEEETGKKYTPWVIEASGGVDRAALFFLIDAYSKDKGRVILKLNPRLAPYKAAVFPLLANKKDLVDKARKVHAMLGERFNVAWDKRGNIGKRYFAQDEIGTPFCVTIDFDTLKDGTVTVRDRDTTKQERIKIDSLESHLHTKLK